MVMICEPFKVYGEALAWAECIVTCRIPCKCGKIKGQAYVIYAKA